MSEGLKITFLGTGTSMGVPVIGCDCLTCSSNDPHDKRLRTSILIEQGEIKVVVDCGPDFRAQMLAAKVRSLSAIVFTHEHKDHTAGLDDVRAYNFIQNKPVQIWASKGVENALRHDYHYAFAEKRYPGVPEIVFNRIGSDEFSIGGLTITPLPVMHHKLQVYGFKIGGFVYITDANSIPKSTWSQIKNADVLVLNALRKTEHISHFTLEEALGIGLETGAKKLYLTHLSHQMGRHEDVEQELPEFAHLAFDGLELYLD
jgi:phosphoribosyl 1,2-cyclic phosphate phosphodiesterase